MLRPFTLQYLLLLSFFFLLSNCQSKVNLENFDNQAFKNDRFACEGKRSRMQEDFERIRLQLKGISENDILGLLGKPDFQQLSTRNQKYYIYFLEKGKQCKDKNAESEAKTAVLRFSSIGLVTEITYETGRPD